MQASELRIGNKINWCTHPVTVTGITGKTIMFINENGEFQREINDHNFTGWVLSPEILEKCGFSAHYIRLI